jgi:hypothetical protein
VEEFQRVKALQPRSDETDYIVRPPLLPFHIFFVAFVLRSPPPGEVSTLMPWGVDYRPSRTSCAFALST